jgi:hypothetical protein
LQTLARIAYELGFKQLMTTALDGVLQMEKGGAQFLEEPFIAVNDRFEHLSMHPNERMWLISSTLEQKEMHDHPSSYFFAEQKLGKH